MGLCEIAIKKSLATSRSLSDPNRGANREPKVLELVSWVLQITMFRVELGHTKHLRTCWATNLQIASDNFKTAHVLPIVIVLLLVPARFTIDEQVACLQLWLTTVTDRMYSHGQPHP
jgi:hypothetical protein